MTPKKHKAEVNWRWWAEMFCWFWALIFGIAILVGVFKHFGKPEHQTPVSAASAVAIPEPTIESWRSTVHSDTAIHLPSATPTFDGDKYGESDGD